MCNVQEGATAGYRPPQDVFFATAGRVLYVEVDI